MVKINMKLFIKNPVGRIHIPLAIVFFGALPLAHAGDATEVSMQVIDREEYPLNVKSINLPDRISKRVVSVQEGLQNRLKKNSTKLKNELRTNLDNFHDKRRTNRDQIKSFFETTLEKIEDSSDNVREKIADFIAPNKDTD